MSICAFASEWRWNRPIILIILLTTLAVNSFAQGTATVSGKVINKDGEPVENARVHIVGTGTGTTADENGNYSLNVPADRELTLQFSYLNFVYTRIKVEALEPGEERTVNAVVQTVLDINPVEIKASQEDKKLMEKIEVTDFEGIPNPGGGIEAILKTLAGVSSNNELSSQYSVRGGNYDENLVYLNGIEVYRPLLIRSGQQEGLSILHPDLVQGLQFSAGGFEARYGDKLSSVLDIQYKEPDSFASKITAGLLGTSVSLEGSSDNHRFTFIAGGRYRSNQYLLNSLDVQGEYKPSFADVQTYLTYDIRDNMELGVLSYYGHNNYLSIPETQETTFGTVSTAVKLKIFFDGREIFQYNTWLNGLTLSWNPGNRTRFKFISSATIIDELEKFDVIGQYSLQELENDFGSEDFGEAVYTFGVGGYLNHARNRLTSQIYNTEWKGEHDLGKRSTLFYGIRFQHERIEDKLSEYQYIDSADYSVPQDNDNVLEVYEYIHSRNAQQWNRYMGYVQNTWNIMPEYNGFITGGIRANYWNFNEEMLISPRLQFSFEPNVKYNRRMLEQGRDTMMRNALRFKASTGFYHQPPFYRELRDLSGILNPDIRAQKSYHFVVGGDYTFDIWGRPFKWSTEVYYKHLKDIIPYEIDNVRIRYYAENSAVGYATGIDVQLNGEFVKDNPSWVSVSVMQTREDILNDSFVVENRETGEKTTTYPGYIPRPTDQRFRFSLFFQDDLPNYPKYKVHLTAVFGSSLPFGTPDYARYKDTLRAPSYRRVDIGFSRQLFNKGESNTTSKFWRGFESIWISAEVFNLFQINNTVSYLWVKDIGGNNWAVPRYLTGRRLNLQLQIKF